MRHILTFLLLSLSCTMIAQETISSVQVYNPYPPSSDSIYFLHTLEDSFLFRIDTNVVLIQKATADRSFTHPVKYNLDANHRFGTITKMEDEKVKIVSIYKDKNGFLSLYYSYVNLSTGQQSISWPVHPNRLTISENGRYAGIIIEEFKKKTNFEYLVIDMINGNNFIGKEVYSKQGIYSRESHSIQLSNMGNLAVLFVDHNRKGPLEKFSTYHLKVFKSQNEPSTFNPTPTDSKLSGLKAFVPRKDGKIELFAFYQDKKGFQGTVNLLLDSSGEEILKNEANKVTLDMVTYDIKDSTQVLKTREKIENHKKVRMPLPISEGECFFTSDGSLFVVNKNVRFSMNTNGSEVSYDVGGPIHVLKFDSNRNFVWGRTIYKYQYGSRKNFETNTWILPNGDIGFYFTDQTKYNNGEIVTDEKGETFKSYDTSKILAIINSDGKVSQNFVLQENSYQFWVITDLGEKLYGETYYDILVQLVEKL